MKESINITPIFESSHKDKNEHLHNQRKTTEGSNTQLMIAEHLSARQLILLCRP